MDEMLQRELEAMLKEKVEELAATRKAVDFRYERWAQLLGELEVMIKAMQEMKKNQLYLPRN